MSDTKRLRVQKPMKKESEAQCHKGGGEKGHQHGQDLKLLGLLEPCP